jgi:hypothetical protein
MVGIVEDGRRGLVQDGGSGLVHPAGAVEHGRGRLLHVRLLVAAAHVTDEVEAVRQHPLQRGMRGIDARIDHGDDTRSRLAQTAVSVANADYPGGGLLEIGLPHGRPVIRLRGTVPELIQDGGRRL